MNRLYHFAFILCVFSLFISCKKDHKVKPETVYVSGVSGDTAILWKDGFATHLSNGIAHAAANQVVIAGSSVYVAGDDLNAGLNSALYWQQNTPNFLPVHKGAGISEARSVFVSGSDLFLAGWAIVNNNLFATSWKNGTATVVDSTHSADCYAIAAANGSVYICGLSLLNGITTATWWKDGVMQTLTTNEQSYAYAIAVSGSDVYIAGTHSLNVLPALWKNGQLTNLSANSGLAGSVAISGTDVYVGGYETVNGITTATVWKNGVAQHMTGGTQASGGYSIFIFNGDVFLAGFVENNNKQQACYWKNGTLVIIGNAGSNASSIVVQ